MNCNKYAPLVLLALTSVAAAQFLPPTPRAPATTKPAKQLRTQLNELRKQSQNADPAVAERALSQLEELGEPGRADLHDAVRQMLAQDRVLIEHLPVKDAAAVLALEQQITGLRKQARVNIDKLDHDETIPAAHKFYSELQPLSDKLMAAMEQRDPVVTALGRRARLVEIFQRSAVPNEQPLSEPEEKKLLATAEKALGMSAAQAIEIVDGDASSEGGETPDALIAHDLWFYRAAKQIDAWNDANKAMMTAGELANFHLVNTYREYLGILPYEADERLVKSARGHSKEMADLKYFDHNSPVASHRSPFDRMREAGYPQPYGENIAFGITSGDKAFWLWFDSPGHHKNMAALGPSSFGVGQNGAYWTQNSGTGERLMLMTADQRREAMKASSESAAR